MEVTKGIIQSAQKVVLYGPEGIGKSTFASKFPSPVFIDTEGSTKHLDVARLPNPSSWTMLIKAVNHVKQNPSICDSLIVDTADWAERLCVDHLCARDKKDGLEGWGYGKGYTYLAEEFGRLLDLLTEIIGLDIHVVLVAHAALRKFEQPDEMGAYDRWEMKLQKKTFPLVKEWADMILFANYKTYVVKTNEGKAKAQGGMRVMYASHHSCWDAKNRHGLPDEMEFYFPVIAHCFPPKEGKEEPQAPTPKQEEAPTPVINKEELEQFEIALKTYNNIPKPLFDLMSTCCVDPEEIQKVVAKKGYYPADTPIDKYDPAFIDGVLIGAWEQVYKMIIENRVTPF